MTHDQLAPPGQAPTTETASAAVLHRLEAALNRHDLDALAACFAANCVSETPAHPDRNFRGGDQIRKNWSRIFAAVPDLRAVLVRSAIDGDRVWAEWDWSGRRGDGAEFAMRGVTLLGLRAARIARVRFYMEPVRADGLGPDAAVEQRVGSVATG